MSSKNILRILSTVPSAPPQNVSLRHRTADTFRVTWSLPPVQHQNGVIRRYNIRVTHLTTSRIETLMSRAQSILIQDLTPNSRYRIEVAAYTVSLGPFSSGLTVYTLEDGEYRNLGNLICTWLNNCGNTQNLATLIIMLVLKIRVHSHKKNNTCMKATAESKNQ